MNEGAAFVAMFAIACCTGVTVVVLNTIKAAIVNRGGRGQNALVSEIRELRDEVRQLRQEHNDVMLALDDTVERRRSVPRSSSDTEQQTLRRG
jgi:hypothetical protein